MRHTIGALAALAVLAVLGAAVVGGCGGATAAQPDSPSPSAPPSGAADITGVVSDLTRGGDAGTVTFLVVADPDVTSVGRPRLGADDCGDHRLVSGGRGTGQN